MMMVKMMMIMMINDDDGVGIGGGAGEIEEDGMEYRKKYHSRGFSHCMKAPH